MTELIPFESDNVVGVWIEGTMSDENFDRITAAVEDKFACHDRIQFYVEIPSFSGMFPAAFFRDLKFTFHRWDRFEKEAIVTGEAWIKKVVPVADMVFSHIEVKAFSMSEKGAARRWAKT